MPIIYTIPDAAAKIKRGLTTTYAHVHALGLGFTSVGGTPLLTEKDVERLRKYKPVRGRPAKQSS